MFYLKAVIDKLEDGDIYRHVPVVCRRPEREPNDRGGLWFTRAEAELLVNHLRTRYDVKAELWESPLMEQDAWYLPHGCDYDPFGDEPDARYVMPQSCQINYPLPFPFVMVCHRTQVSEREVDSMAELVEQVIHTTGCDLPSGDTLKNAVRATLTTCNEQQRGKR